MLAKKFRLPIQGWLKDKKKKTITKKSDFFIIKTALNDLKFNRFGIIVGSRIVKKATQRNRLKRTIFNFVRLNTINQLPNKDILIIVQQPASRAKKTEMEKELNSLIVLH